MHFVGGGNRHDETYSAVRRKKEKDDDYTLYHRKTQTHTDTDTHAYKADRRERRRNGEKNIKRFRRTQYMKKNNVGYGQTARERANQLRGEKKMK